MVNVEAECARNVRECRVRGAGRGRVCCEFGYSLCGGVFTQDGGRELGRGLLKAASRTCAQTSAAKSSGK